MTDSSDDATNEIRTNYMHSWRLFIVIACLFFATFLVAIDTSMVTVTVPTITTDFHSLASVAWISSAYTLAMTALQPTFGACYRLFRVERIYIICILLFEVGSVICSVAPNGVAFILGRAVQGIGGAGILQGSLAIIGHTVEPEKRPVYIGIITSVYGVAMAFGPILGGAFTTRLTWRWCYWMNVNQLTRQTHYLFHTEIFRSARSALPRSLSFYESIPRRATREPCRCARSCRNSICLGH